MRDWIDHESRLTLDVAETCDACAATYQVQVEWHRGKIIEAVNATLVNWVFGGRHQSRAIAVSLIGEEAVKEQEEAACEEWWERHIGLEAPGFALPAIAAE